MTNPLHSDAFGDRGRGSEEAYFRTKDAELVEKLRSVFQAKVDKEQIRRETGITNEEVLDRLVSAHLEGELLAAFKLYPLVEIAWADGSFDSKEADAVVYAAVKSGVPRDSKPMEHLQRWLHTGPTPDGKTLWRHFAKELRKTLSPAELETFRNDLLNRAHAVAEASGGILYTFLNMTKAKKKVLEEISRALTHD
jgi:hypothetical protein